MPAINSNSKIRKGWSCKLQKAPHPRRPTIRFRKSCATSPAASLEYSLDFQEVHHSWFLVLSLRITVHHERATRQGPYRITVLVLSFAATVKRMPTSLLNSVHLHHCTVSSNKGLGD